MVYSSPSISTHSWSNLPLDLLTSIAERLVVRSDLLSFRFICSHWRSAVPRPKHLPWYSTCQTCTGNKDPRVFVLRSGERIVLSIPLPFPSYGTEFLLPSNGWLLFRTHHYSYYLFDPVSQRIHWLPPLPRPNVRQRNDIIRRTVLIMAAVSTSRNGGVAVAGIADADDQMGDVIGNRFYFIEIINGKTNKSWHFSKKRCDNKMVGIVEGGDGKRFYAADEKWGIYLLEAGPLMRWRRFNLKLPKHISSEVDLEESGKKRPSMSCCGLTERDDGYLEAQGICLTNWKNMGTFPLLKVHPSGLRMYSKDMYVYGDEKWIDVFPSSCFSNHIFRPRL